MFTDISILEKLQVFPREILTDFTKEILYRKFQEATSLDTPGLQGKRKFEEKEIAEGVREMNFRKIFFMETIGETEGEKQGREQEDYKTGVRLV